MATGVGSTVSVADHAKAIYVFANEKGGMANNNSEVINSIILETSGNSAYTAKQLKSDDRVNQSVDEYRQKLAASGEAEHHGARLAVEKRTAELERQRQRGRVHVVIDFDMFYAAVEIRDRPELADKPVAIGGVGMISTANYVARRWGVRSAMPGFVGQALCRRGPEFGMPQAELVFVKPDYDKYSLVAEIARAIYREYDSSMRSYSLDEAYLDITDYLHLRLELGSHFLVLQSTQGSCSTSHKTQSLQKSREGISKPWLNGTDDTDVFAAELRRLQRLTSLAEEVVTEIRQRVQEATQGLTTSAGIGPTAMLAKIAADQRKPNGQFCVGGTREDILSFLAPLPTRKVPGIGRVQEKVLSAVLGVRTCGDLLRHAPELRLLFTEKTADLLLCKALGCGDTIEAHFEKDGSNNSLQKGISCERTFQATGSAPELHGMLTRLCTSLAAQMAERRIHGSNVTLKIKTDRFDVFTRDVSCGRPVGCAADLLKRCKPMLDKFLSAGTQRLSNNPYAELRLRLMGVRVSKLEPIERTAVRISTLLASKSAVSQECAGEQTNGCGDEMGTKQSIATNEASDESAALAWPPLKSRRIGEENWRDRNAPCLEMRPLKYQQLTSEDMDPAVLAELPKELQDELELELAQRSNEQRIRSPQHAASRNRKASTRQHVRQPGQSLLHDFIARSSTGNSAKETLMKSDVSRSASCADQQTSKSLPNLQALVDMGFTQWAAQDALTATGGNLDNALESLLQS